MAPQNIQDGISDLPPYDAYSWLQATARAALRLRMPAEGRAASS